MGVHDFSINPKRENLQNKEKPSEVTVTEIVAEVDASADVEAEAEADAEVEESADDEETSKPSSDEPAGAKKF